MTAETSPSGNGGPASGGGARRDVFRAAAIVGAATLASRVLGFLRDLLVARAFGAGATTDAFFVAFRIPNLLRRLLAEGALSSAFIPVFTEYLTRRPRPEFLRMLRAVTGGLGATLGVVTVAGILTAPWIVRAMAPGFFADPVVGQLAVDLTRLMFPYLFLVGLAALAMGVLNAQRAFLAPALSPVALNLGIIAAVLLLAPVLAQPVFALAAGVLAGGVGQLLVQVPALRARATLVMPSAELRHAAVRRIVRLMGPVAVGQSASHLSTVINTIIASFLAGGSVSYLYYADRLVEFPLGVFGIAIATAVLPTLSEQAARGDTAALRDTLAFAQRLAAFITLPAAVGLLVLREPLVRVLYQRGEFGPAETAGTAAALAAYAVGLVGFGSAKIGAQAFYALGDTRTPVTVAIAAMALGSALGVVFAIALGHAGLALATSCAGTANAGGLAWLLRRRLGPPTAAGARSWLRLVAASAVLAAALLAVTARWAPPAGRLAETAWVGGLVLGGAAVYAALALGLGSDEARYAVRALVAAARRRVLR